MIEYHGFAKRFGKLVAVDGLELSVRRGETLALIGPNGSGKTTTLKAALGLVRPSEGRVTVGGIDVARDGRAARARLGYLPQRLSFAEGFTAREVIGFFARLRGASRTDADALLSRVGLADAANRVAEDFSGGMKQRLGIAMALLGSPDALILDEPTAALDPTGSLDVRDLVAEIAGEGKTVLLSSHDLAEVAALADRIAVFTGGRLVALGTPAELARQASMSHPVPDLEHIYRAFTAPRPRLAA